VDGQSVVESRKKCVVINGIGKEGMKGEKKEMPKIKNKKTRNETLKDDCLTCLKRWRSCYDTVGWRTFQNPRVQRTQRPTAAASSC
jgi:hypothetical protein